MGHLGHRGTAQRAGRGSLAGSWPARADNRPNLHGSITLDVDLRAGDKLWLSAWTRAIGGAEWLSIEATVAIGGRRKGRSRRRRDVTWEPVGKFTDAPAASRVGVLHHIGPEQQPRGQSDEERDDQVVESVTHAEE